MHLSGFAPDEAYSVAQDLAASGQDWDAIAAYSSAISGDPDHISARVGRGLAWQRLGEHLKALADFDVVISSFADWPGVFIAYYGRAASLQASGKITEAIADCDEAISRNSECADALYLRGIMRKSLGHVEMAICDMDAVLRIDPHCYEAFFVRGGLHYLQQHCEQAIADLTVAIEQNPEVAANICEGLYLRGVAFQQLGEHRLAIADFTRAIELAPGDGAAYLRRSRSYQEIGELGLAAADFQVGMRFTAAST